MLGALMRHLKTLTRDETELLDLDTIVRISTPDGYTREYDVVGCEATKGEAAMVRARALT